MSLREEKILRKIEVSGLLRCKFGEQEAPGTCRVLACCVELQSRTQHPLSPHNFTYTFLLSRP